MGPSLTEANILSIHGSIEYDMGNLETALGLLAKSLELFRSIGHIKGVAEVTVQESAAVLAANQPERALTRAEDALQFLTPQNARLLMLAKSIITESLVLLGRLPEALRNFTETEPLYQEVGGELTFLKVTYLRARILDALELNREAEKLFRRAINGLTDAEIYKDAFLIRLTFFESLFKRGAFRKAVQVCEEAINQLKQTGRVHTQMSQVWKDLLGAVEAEVLKEYHLADMRNYLIRHWASPAPRAPVFSGHSNSN
jgi:tetratricopeptide (TPR) repeat protein